MNLKSVFLSLCLCTGFFVKAQTGFTVIDSIYNVGQWRSYRLYVPLNYDGSKAVPLILNLHGLGSNALEQQLYGNFMDIADTAGFLILIPNGSQQSSIRFWNVGVLPAPDDVGFIAALIDTIRAEYLIDVNATYCTGMSNGGIMSYYLACHLPNTFAAIASVAGTMFAPWAVNCSPPKAMPVMEIHGTDDGTVPYEGDSTALLGNYLPIDSVIKKWRLFNMCPDNPQVTSFADINIFDFSQAIDLRYVGGRDNSRVELIKVLGGGHTWPGAPAIFSGTNQDFNASAEIWRFFRPYKLSQFISITALENEHLQQSVLVSPNPFTEGINIKCPSDAKIILYDVQGLEVQVLKNGWNGLNSIPAGFYSLRISKGAATLNYKIIKQ